MFSKMDFVSGKIHVVCIFALFFFASCSSATEILVTTTPTFSKFLPSTWTPTITLTTTVMPTVSPIPTATITHPPLLVPTSNINLLNPGVYPTFWRDGSIYIGFLSGGTSIELVRLYDQPTQTSLSGDITYLDNTGRDTIVSPNGQTIAYMNMEDGFIYIYDLMTKEKNRIVQPDTGSIERNWQGDWSLDGNYLLYAIDSKQLDENQMYGQEFLSIFITDFHQKTFSQITMWNTVEESPSWSPDGQWIAFASDNMKVDSRAIGNFVGATDIFVMSTKCLNQIVSCKNSFFKQLTDTGIKGDAFAPDWQPNSSDIGYIYINGQSGDRDIYVADIDGNLKNLTDTTGALEESFSWSPDGNKMVFKRTIPGFGTDLYILNLADNITTNLTYSPTVEEGDPSWSPDGQEIAFDQDVNDGDSGVMIYSVSSQESLLLPDSEESSFLFWLTVFPEISNGADLIVSPSGEDLNLRGEPSMDGTILAKLPSGSLIRVLDEPVVTNGYTWWKVRHENMDGWVAQIYSWYLPATSMP